MNRPHTQPSIDSFIHLSEDQLDEVLITGLEDSVDSDLAPSVAAHLAACPHCAARLEDTRLPLTAFAAASLAWSERRSSTLPLRPDFAAYGSWNIRAVYATAVTAALALIVAMPALHRAPADPVAVASSASSTTLSTAPAAAAPTEFAEAGPAPALSPAFARSSSASRARIDRDNQMLSAIDRELDASVEDPAALGLQTVSAPDERQPSALAPSLQD